jgi:hypothetical protein
MYKDIIAFCSEVRTHTNVSCGKNGEYLLVVSKGTIGLYSVIVTEL